MNPTRSSLQIRNEMNQQQLTYLDQVFDICLYKNSYEKILGDKLKDQINLELYFEKLSLAQLSVKAFNQNYIPLFQRLLNKDGFKEAIVKIFNNERSTLNAFELLEELSIFYLRNCAPKNIYEHPISILGGFNVENQLFMRSNNNQTSQSSGH